MPGKKNHIEWDFVTKFAPYRSDIVMGDDVEDEDDPTSTDIPEISLVSSDRGGSNKIFINAVQLTDEDEQNLDDSVSVTLNLYAGIAVGSIGLEHDETPVTDLTVWTFVEAKTITSKVGGQLACFDNLYGGRYKILLTGFGSNAAGYLHLLEAHTA